MDKSKQKSHQYLFFLHKKFQIICRKICILEFICIKMVKDYAMKVRIAYMPTPAMAHISRLFVFLATNKTTRPAMKGRASGQKPVRNKLWLNRSFATSAEKAAGAIKFKPSVARGDKVLPLSSRAGATLHINIHTVMTARIIQYSVQLIMPLTCLNIYHFVFVRAIKLFKF